MNIKVTKIPAKVKVDLSHRLTQAKKRVCGYARVSTEEDEQQNSYETQINYYTNFIKQHNNWEFVGMYADEGISGTSTRHRLGFNQMITDALNGKIDLILTKSVSRFARNTVDSLSNIRKLKEHGVEVYFEKENIYTLDSKGEVLLTIMGSLAQEESRSISENTLWGIKKKMESGKFSLPYSSFLGYDFKDGKLIINKEQAKTIKIIYKLYLEGKSINTIKTYLEDHGYKTGTNKPKWYHNSIKQILTNEKYKGDVRLQKFYTTDYLSHKSKLNKGEKESFYIENDHEAIIDKKMFDLVQIEVAKRENHAKKNGKSRASLNTELYNKVVCGSCKAIMKRKVLHSNDERYRSVVYKCDNNDIKIDENELKDSFTKAYNDVLGNTNKNTIDDMKMVQKIVSNTTKETIEKERLEKTVLKLTNELNALILTNAQKLQSQKEYNKQFKEISNRLNEEQLKLAEIEKLIESKQERGAKISTYIDTMKSDKLGDYEAQKVVATVDLIEIYKDKIIIKWLSGNATVVERTKK